MPPEHKDQRMRSAVQQNATTEYPLSMSAGKIGHAGFFQWIQRRIVQKTEQT
jgi:hypothetical protein